MGIQPPTLPLDTVRIISLYVLLLSTSDNLGPVSTVTSQILYAEKSVQLRSTDPKLVLFAHYLLRSNVRLEERPEFGAAVVDRMQPSIRRTRRESWQTTHISYHTLSNADAGARSQHDQSNAVPAGQRLVPAMEMIQLFCLYVL
jgi:hypothetical protein